MTQPGGVWVAALTPMNPDLSPDTAKFVAHCKWLLAQGANGLAVLGTTGEANSFTVAEKRKLLDAVAASGISGSQMLPGTGACAIPDTVEMTKHALSHGAAGVVMLPPFYYKNVSDDGLFAAYSEVIQRVGDSKLRVYFYHFPQMSATPISHDLIERLLKAYPGTIAGIKDSSGKLDNMLEMCRRFPGFGVFAGSEQFLLPVLRAGGVGCISATANATIGMCVEVLKKKDDPSVDALQEELTAQRLAIQSQVLIPALKSIAARHSGDKSWLTVRPPVAPLSAAEETALFAALDGTQFKLAA
jgi:4-hydroxy-tetrahydrodipicolinate synthase